MIHSRATTARMYALSTSWKLDPQSSSSCLRLAKRFQQKLCNQRAERHLAGRWTGAVPVPVLYNAHWPRLASQPTVYERAYQIQRLGVLPRFSSWAQKTRPAGYGITFRAIPVDKMITLMTPQLKLATLKPEVLLRPVGTPRNHAWLQSPIDRRRRQASTP
jgi:hypothetical protein